MTSLFLGQCSDKKKADDQKTEAKQEIKEEEPIVLVDIQKIVNKSVSEVGTVWGKAEKTETVEGTHVVNPSVREYFLVMENMR